MWSKLEGQGSCSQPCVPKHHTGHILLLVLSFRQGHSVSLADLEVTVYPSLTPEIPCCSLSKVGIPNVSHRAQFNQLSVLQPLTF